MGTRLKRTLLLIMTLALLFAAGANIAPLQELRQRYDLSSEPEKGISPQVALATQVLGWGRGIIIDVLWIRMEALKNADKYFELVQLADWACKLAPRFPKVWDFQAWNLAYNVSCRVDYLLDRWDWVWSGISLLRDRGIVENPNAWELYESLSWMIMHKIGQQDDNAHFFYKQQFALDVHSALGGSGERSILKALAQMPDERSVLLADPEVSAIVQPCSEMGFDVIDSFFDLLARRQAVPSGVVEIVERPANAKGMAKIEAFVRRRRIKREFGLDPQIMLELMDEYGDFDWRSPYPYALYWAEIGARRLAEFQERYEEKAEQYGLRTTKQSDTHGQQGLYEWHEVQFIRLIYMALQSQVMHGRILYNTRGELVADMGTDYRFADKTMEVFEEASGEFRERFENGVEQGYEYFLRRGIIEFYFMGDTDKSQRYYATLSKRFPDETYGKNYGEYIEWALDDYMSAMTFSDVRRLLRGYSYNYYICIGSNADAKAEALEGEAKAIAKHYNDDATQLREMVRYEEIKNSALTDILSGVVAVAPDVLANLKARLNEIQPGVVDLILENLRKSGKLPPEREKIDEDLLHDTPRPSR